MQDRAIMATNGAPACFIVACSGHSGSKWLAKNLNAHPDIVCSHAFQPPPFSIIGDPAADALEKSLKGEEAQRRHDEGVPRVNNLPLDKLFQELICYADARAYGNVHMYSVRALLESAERFPPSTTIQIASLIRHPVPLVESRAGSFTEYMVNAPSMRRYCMNMFLTRAEILAPLVLKYQLDLDEAATLGFLAAAASLAGLVLDIEAWPDIWFVKMEDLTSDRKSFAHFVREITAGTVTADAQYLDKVFSAGKVNQHSRNSGLDPAERYATWPHWQKHAYFEMSKRFNLSGVYGMFGYDFSFLDGNRRPLGRKPSVATSASLRQ